MSLSEELRRLRRQFLKEVDVLQRQHEEQAQRLDDRFARVDRQFERVQASLVATNDEVAALRGELQGVRSEAADPAAIEDLTLRVERLEKGSSPAA